MEVEVCFYGSLVHLAGGRLRTLHVQGNAPSVAELKEAIAREIPAMAPHLVHTAVGVGVELLSDSDVLKPSVQVALLPPVSGG